MNETLTVPQQKVLDYLQENGEIEVGLLKKHGLDVRAANNLVKRKTLTFTGGVYRLRERKKPAKTEALAEETAPANDVEAPSEASMPKPKKGTRKQARTAKVANPTEKCLCGCGAELDVKRRFQIGHDAKLHSLVLRVYRGKADKSELPTSEATLEYLRSAPWMKDEIAKALDLW